ncbi:MAG: hydroxyphenylacetyl-CoA thioesterase PaaI [Rhodocyclaceae bacterium]|nr:hydroxyphenylacetyl-CoA thioesterase PaaI [Rhodocyclaceae bacterium]MBX3666903.1 hydroxyphenylacetyl-CoA thioesterase PaaI [Rhodocyclaceae bacterium]
MSDTQAKALEVAHRSAHAMWLADHAAHALGMELVETGSGSAVLAMRVQSSMVNGHGLCHGGLIFALADTAFAYACNSFNRRAVAAGASIDFLSPAYLGDRLYARATLHHQGERSGIYDVKVENQAGRLIALFRGRARRIAGKLFDDADA